MPADYSSNDLTQLLLARIPELQDDLDDEEGLYLQLGTFARFTQEAKGQSDWERYARCVILASELLARPEPDLQNALHVSYLEHLDFDGPRGAEAWQLLTPELQRAWKSMRGRADR